MNISTIFRKGDKTLEQAGDNYIKMDFSLETSEERVKKVEEIIANTPPEKLNSVYLEKLTKYILFPKKDKTKKLTKEEKNVILSDNHMITVNKRETSFEGLVGKLENGEDGIYNMITNDKNIIFAPKCPITEEDIKTIPGLKELVEAIKQVEAECKIASGKRAYLLRKQLIELRKDQYQLKNLYRRPVYVMNITKSLSKINLDEKVTLDAEGEIRSTGLINLFNPKHISALLCNYSQIKEECWDKFDSDIRWLMVDLEFLVDRTLKEDYPLYYDLLIYKIDGKSNAEIQELLYEDYNIKHSVEYISSLWRNKIPKMIADKATDEWLIWYYTKEEPKKFKKCSRCGQMKPAHNRFFSKNSTSKDGWYSICKCCRNNKNKGVI